MKLARIFNADLHNIHHAAFWLAFFSASSAVLGMCRDRLLAGKFGASRTLDIYYASFRVPDFIYTLLLLFTASTALIPAILEKLDKGLSKDVEEFLGSLMAFFFVFIFVLEIIAFFLIPHFTRVSLPGFSESDQRLAILISRILLLSPLFLGFSNIFSSITKSLRKFFVYGLSPVFYNLGIIVGILFFVDLFGLAGLALGVILGAFLHMAIQVPVIFTSKIIPKFRRFWHKDVRKIFLLSLPRTLGLEIHQVSWIIFTGIASTLSQGSISILNLASNLEYIPITVIGLSYSVATFPGLAAYSLKHAKDHFAEHFSAAFRHILFWAVPFSALLLVLRAQVVRIILGSGEFSWVDTRLTAAALFLLSLAVVFQSLFMLLVRAFYAEGESWRPLVINVIATVLSIGAILWFLGALSPGSFFNDLVGNILKLSDIQDIRVIALPLGILIGSFANFLFLSLAFRVLLGWFPTKGSERAILEIFFASTMGAFVAYFSLNAFAKIFDLHTFLGIFFQGALSGTLGLLMIAGILWVLRNKELLEIYENVRALFSEKE